MNKRVKLLESMCIYKKYTNNWGINNSDGKWIVPTYISHIQGEMVASYAPPYLGKKRDSYDCQGLLHTGQRWRYKKLIYIFMVKIQNLLQE